MATHYVLPDRTLMMAEVGDSIVFPNEPEVTHIVTDVNVRRQEIFFDNEVLAHKRDETVQNDDGEQVPIRVTIYRPRYQFSPSYHNAVLKPAAWVTRNPSNRLKGNIATDEHFQNYLKDNARKVSPSARKAPTKSGGVSLKKSAADKQE